MWGMRHANQLRTKIEPGDWIAFYGSKLGVLASARARESAVELVPPDSWPDTSPPRRDVYRLGVDSVVWLRQPITVPSVQDRLMCFRGRSTRATENWAWLVNSTRRIDEQDFLTLTGR